MRWKDAGGGFGNIGGGGDGNADLRLPQRRRIVSAVPAHAHRVTGLLKGLHQLEFVLRQNAGKNGEGLRPNRIGNRTRRTHRSIQTNGTRHNRRRRRSIAGHHHRPHSKLFQLRHQRGRIIAWRVAERNQSQKHQASRRACCYCQHPIPFGFQFMRRRSRGGRTLSQRTNHCERALDNTFVP
jgi:hypothetical protein